MRHVKPLLALVAILAGGCAGASTADKASTLALDQIGQYEADVNKKVRVENDYYDEVIDNAVARINRLRESEQDTKLKALAREFAEGHKSSDPAAIAKDLPPFFTSAVNEWAAREGAYELLITKTQATLSTNRKRLDVEQAKVQELKVKLRALGEPGTTFDMLKMAVAFGQEVKVKYDELKADADKAAAAAAAKPPDDTTKK
jgi:hypothetical protein